MALKAEKDRFSDRLGWEMHSFPGSAISPQRRPWFTNDPSNWRFLGMGPGTTAGSGEIARAADVPYWLLIFIFGAPVLLAAKRYRKLTNRAKEGRCLKCGYQLDVSMTTCPECGETRSAVHAAP